MGEKKTSLREQFLLNQIRRYNAAGRQIHRDRCLLAVGIYVQIFPKEKAKVQPKLTQEERNTILCFLRQFCQQGLQIELKGEQ
jgi:hypothetical protein